MSSSKDRVILTSVLTSVFSSTTPALILGLQNQPTEKLKQNIKNILSEVDKNQEERESEPQNHLEAFISKLQTDLDRCERERNIKRAWLHDKEAANIKMKTERLERLPGGSKKDLKKTISHRLFHKWKQNLLRKAKAEGGTWFY